MQTKNSQLASDLRLRTTAANPNKMERPAAVKHKMVAMFTS